MIRIWSPLNHFPTLLGLHGLQPLRPHSWCGGPECKSGIAGAQDLKSCGNKALTVVLIALLTLAEEGQKVIPIPDQPFERRVCTKELQRNSFSKGEIKSQCSQRPRSGSYN